MFDTIIINKVREKKELCNLSKDFIIYHYAEFIRLDKKIKQKIQSYSQEDFAKSKELLLIVKYIREKSRKIYGVFQIPKTLLLREELVNLRLDDSKIIAILQTHLSTKERLLYYDDFFNVIFSHIPYFVKSILDLACGLNPIAYYYYTKNIDMKYVCSEFSEIDVKQLQSFFSAQKLPAKAICFDLVREYHKIPSQQFDVCFLLKTLDTCETQKKYVTYDILKHIQAKTFVVSFPYQNVKGIVMKRSTIINWFEKMVSRLDLTFEKIEFLGEIVYICTKVTPKQ